MANFTLTHELDCDVDRFWKIFFDTELTKKLFADLGFPSFEILEQKETETEIKRRIKATPKLDAPAAVAKVLGPGFGYVEDGTFDRASKVHRFVIKPNTLEGRLKNEGSIRAEPAGPGKCRRVVDVVAEAKIFGIGSAIEKMTEKTYRDSWGKSAELINKYIRENP